MVIKFEPLPPSLVGNTMTSKISFLFDIEETADAHLRIRYPATYDSLLEIWKTEEKDARYWYVDTRADPHLFYGLLAFAKPDIFEKIYKNHQKCKLLLKNALEFMYDHPLPAGV